MDDPFARLSERHSLCGKDAALWIHHFDQHPVLATRQVNQDDGVALAVIRPLPRQVVDSNVQMLAGLQKRVILGVDAELRRSGMRAR
jgi:hypothetical protein